MYECGTCGKEFYAGYDARENHCRSTGHYPPAFECDTCDRHFVNEQARQQHMDAKRHHYDDDDVSEYSSEESDSDYEEFFCAVCGEGFDDDDDCFDHEVEYHFYCSDCDRYFAKLQGIECHLNSPIHGGPTVRCPLCAFTHTNASAIADHVERGHCPGAPDMNKDRLHELVRSKDPNSRISRKSVFGNRTSVAAVRYAANEKTWKKGRGYVCFFCQEGFTSLDGLNNHLNSDAHEEPLYHCPNGNCRPTFKSLASAMSHLESESCGAMRADKVAKLLNTILKGNGNINC